jgi:hypothetical protein
VRPARPLAAAAVIAALAGCGGDDHKTLSAAAYRREASRICADANRRAGAIARPRDLAGLRGYLDQTLVIIEQDTDRLRRLRPPAALRSGHAAALRVQDAAIRRLRALRGELDARRPSVKKLRDGLADVQRLGDRADRRFRAIGLSPCAG